MNQELLISRLGKRNYFYCIVFAYVFLPIIWLLISIAVSYSSFYERKLFSIFILIIGVAQLLILLRVFASYKNKLYGKI